LSAAGPSTWRRPCHLLATACALLGGAAEAGAMTLTSTTWADGGRIPDRSAYDRAGCSGGNASPQVAWAGAPPGTRSYAVTVFDPDAPGGAGWWHWIVLNIPAATTALPEGAGSGAGSLPAGALQARSDWGAARYGGPCPPSGSTHCYVITTYALDVARLAAPRAGAELDAVLRGHVLASASLVARYGR
jgi:Raf kinase inhibitor-like YbhB/YbcL family protein